MVVVPVALIVTLLLYPFGGSQTTSTAPEFLPTAPRTTSLTTPRTTQATAPGTTPVTHAPPLRTERPTRQTVRTPTPLPPPPSPTPADATTPPGPTATASTPGASTAAASTPLPGVRATPVVYKNCAEVRAAGKAPLHRGDPGYSSALDRNGDGEACGDRGNS